MTRIFVYEYTCAAPPTSVELGGAASLRAEGEAMLHAVLSDFERISGVEAVTIRSALDEESAFRAAARRADWSLIIAPEFDQILETRCRWVLEQGGRLLGPSPQAVSLCADKFALFHWWSGRNVRTPPTREWESGIPWGESERIALKPRFGAGGMNTHFLHRGLAVPEECRHTPMIVQPLIAGFAASVAFLIGPSSRIPLRACSQILDSGTECVYRGGCLPLLQPIEERAQRIALSAIHGFPGLLGYVGVDVVLGDDGCDWAIEINSRLTTSYVGLRRLAETNLAQAMLRVACGESPAVKWRRGSVEFGTDGTAILREA